MSAAQHPAISAWLQCPEAAKWPPRIDLMLVATWRGAEIGWPQFDGECFAIFRISDSRDISEEELPSHEAIRLAWSQIRFAPALDLTAHEAGA